MAGITALLNVNMFDGTGHEPYAPGAIVIDGQRIQAIGPVSRVSIPRDAQVLDLAGKTAMPGLIDAHTRVGWVENRFRVDVEDQPPGGGAGSPTDPLDAPQFTPEELAAAVYEARVVKKPVMAHVYVPEGIKNCVKAGVATIKHGNFLDEELAALMTQHGTYLVPMLTVFEFISRYGREQGLAETTLEKIELGKTAAR